MTNYVAAMIIHGLDSQAVIVEVPADWEADISAFGDNLECE